ncbi:hypothetical protein B5X24_HaOG210065 [Helicoverpa armigera]|nr:hypothetical protein B5X24_HaOG210065 [Helicoverpa armigera]
MHIHKNPPDPQIDLLMIDVEIRQFSKDCRPLFKSSSTQIRGLIKLVDDSEVSFQVLIIDGASVLCAGVGCVVLGNIKIACCYKLF